MPGILLPAKLVLASGPHQWKIIATFPSDHLQLYLGSGFPSGLRSLYNGHKIHCESSGNWHLVKSDPQKPPHPSVKRFQLLRLQSSDHRLFPWRDCPAHLSSRWPNRPVYCHSPKDMHFHAIQKTMHCRVLSHTPKPTRLFWHFHQSENARPD